MAIEYFAEYEYDYNRMDVFERYTESSVRTVMQAQAEARNARQNYIGSEHVLCGICGQNGTNADQALKRYDMDLKELRKEIDKILGPAARFIPTEIPFTPRAKRIMERAVLESRDLHHVFISSDHILLAITSDPCCVAAQMIRMFQPDLHKLRFTVLAIINGGDPDDEDQEFFRPVSETEQLIIERELRGSPTPLLEEFSENLTRSAIDGKLDPVMGRDKEIAAVVRCLARRRKNNPVLIGEPGVGKTAVAEGLALMTLSDRIPRFLIGCSIMAMDLGAVLAGTKYRGEFEERIKFIVEEVEEDSTVIVLIDEIHILVGAGAAEGAVDAANILKPALARGKFKCMGATTISEYRQHIEKDAALERRFVPITVDEPTVEETVDILIGLREKFEQHHLVHYETKALKLAATLSAKYINDRFLPDKAIDIMDDAGAKVQLEFRGEHPDIKKCMKELKDTLGDKQVCVRNNYFNVIADLMTHELEVRTYLGVVRKAEEENEKFLKGKPVTANEIREALAARKGLPVFSGVDKVREEDVLVVVSRWTGVPLNKLSTDDEDKLVNMESNLHKRLIGQEEAVSAVAKAIRRARVGLRSKNRPIGSFIFAGPTGVGKTELTKAIADYMFGEEDTMIRIDMTEYMEKHTVAKLIGSPPGYVGYGEGGQLTEAVRTKPYSVVLLDEVEKAHGDIFNILLQVLDDGHLTDSKGKEIDFTNTLLVMTTNLGAKAIEKNAAFLKDDIEDNGPDFGDLTKYLEQDPDEQSRKKVPKRIRQVRRFMRQKPRTPREPTDLERMEIDMGFLTMEQIEKEDALKEIEKIKKFDSFSFVEANKEELIPRKPEKRSEEEIKKTKDLVMEELRKFFRPEFINRIDDTIVFDHLTLYDLWQIAGIMIENIGKRLKEDKYFLTVANNVRSWIVEQGYDPKYGARPLRRAVTSTLEDALTEYCLTHPLYENTEIFVSRKSVKGDEDSDYRDYYLDELEIRFDYSKVDPILIEQARIKKEQAKVKQQQKEEKEMTPEEIERKLDEEDADRREFIYDLDPEEFRIPRMQLTSDFYWMSFWDGMRSARRKQKRYVNRYLKGIVLGENDKFDFS